MFRISLVQMQSEKSEIHKNLDTITHYLEAARQRNCDFVAFPEMSLTGYAAPTRFPQAVLNQDGPEVQLLLELSKGYDVLVLVGIIEANPFGKLFITQLVIRRGKMIGFYRKITIVDEDFPGGGYLYSPGGERVLASQDHLPGALYFELDTATRHVREL